MEIPAGLRLFDTSAGSMRLSDELVLRRDLPREQLQQCVELRVFVDHRNGYVWYTLPPIAIDGGTLGVSLCMREDRLETIHFGLSIDVPREDFYDAQPALQERHVAWLREQLGTPSSSEQDGRSVQYGYVWGSIGAYLNPKDGISRMVLAWK